MKLVIEPMFYNGTQREMTMGHVLMNEDEVEGPGAMLMGWWCDPVLTRRGGRAS